jgi:hypothetical protein
MSDTEQLEALSDQAARHRARALRLLTQGKWLARISVTLVLVTTTIQLATGDTSWFLPAANTFTIGVLTITAALLAKADRALNRKKDGRT